MAQSQEINLIPHDVLMRDRMLERIWIWAGIVSLVIIILFGIYMLEKKNIGTVEGLVADLSLKKLEMESKIDQLSILNEKRDTLAIKERVINSLLNKRSLTRIFAELEKAMSSRVRLTSFDFIDGFSLAGSLQGIDSDTWVDTGYMIVKKDGSEGKKDSERETLVVEVMLHGIADSNKDVAGFLERLSESVIFSEVNLIYLQEEKVEERSVVEFEIETYLKNM